MCTSARRRCSAELQKGAQCVESGRSADLDEDERCRVPDERFVRLWAVFGRCAIRRYVEVPYGSCGAKSRPHGTWLGAKSEYSRNLQMVKARRRV